MHDEQIRFRQLKKQELEETDQQEQKEESLRKKNVFFKFRRKSKPKPERFWTRK